MIISLTTIFFSSFLLALSGALMPGPLLTVTISETVHRGVRTGPLMIFGHGLLELFLVIGLAAGLAPLLKLPLVFILISTIGGAILLMMAISMLRSLPSMKLITEASNERKKNLVFTGALLSLINPFWLLWWATIGLGYILQTLEYGFIGVGVFFIGHILADLSWYALVSFGIARGKHFFNDTHYKILIGSCGSFLLFFSVWFFYNGINTFIQVKSTLL